ncbi:DegT/DnrJ/EryC1/StrS family aminotransferase [Saccharicrinis sp. FJH54]|uniref:DegT/DnrJ/EryC1/StrS family aminotransferase n=1 Tax=Saccharicrinis sp. FJH54 TaxID=3344665 RepID=UPI0035D462B4
MEKILVTQPFLPPLEEVEPYLKQIWENKWLTNKGPFHQELEQKLADYLDVEYISLFSNGTLALLIALKALNIKGEVITTPYTFVATSHTLLWNNLTPVFADVDPVYGNLDPEAVENAITPNTTAILPVHVYGNPCDVKGLQEVADKHNLKIIYDAAHAFGVKVNEKSIMQYGDLSVMSFHATKLFNTFEGGAIACHTEEMKTKIDHLKNFGFDGETTIIGTGINAKMNEFSAVMGLLQLNHFKEILHKRQTIAERYRKNLKGISGLRFLYEMAGVDHNNAYFPVFLEKNYPLDRDTLYQKLKDQNIYGRRYFYPLISWLDSYQNRPSSHASNLPEAEKLASQVICLPIYPDLDLEIVDFVCDIIASHTNR